MTYYLGHGTDRADIIHPCLWPIASAGAQCVLVMLWAVNDLVRDKFWHHFYLALQEGTMVTKAVHAAKQAIKQDNRWVG